MMNEVRVILRIRRDIRLYKRSLVDVSDEGLYVKGIIFGLSRAVELIMGMAKATHKNERQWRIQARFFNAGWLLRKMAFHHKLLLSSDKTRVMNDLKSIIRKSQKGTPCNSANTSYRESI